MMADKEIVVKDEMVVSMEYTLRVDGEIIERSEQGEPIQFIQGIGQVVPGLEDALYGMQVGEGKKVTIPPEEGYGEIDEDAVAEIPADDFPDDIPLEPGVGLILKDDEGDEQEAYILDVDDGMVYLSLNHPLAGEELEFEIKVIGLREADEDELDHGHVHPDS
jgi:FKBP-type peptidyl-prolyl cis-trans isomerase SlyD